MSKNTKYYAIRNEEHPDWYWNENWGWMNVPAGEEGEISLYTEEEKANFSIMNEKGRLPFQGEWVEL